MSRIERFRKLHGPGEACEQAHPSVLERYRHKLPEDFLSEWEHSGWCAYARGRIWTVNPDLFIDTIREWLPDWCLGEDNQPIVFARGPFGDLLVYYNGEVGQLNVHYGRYIVVNPTGLDLFLGFSLTEKYIDNALDGKLALGAIKKLGPLAFDEMFTFEPALALGGATKLKYVKKVKMLPQLNILAQLFDEVTVE